MNILKELVTFIESLFQHHAPEIVKAATIAATEAAVTDPKIQAGVEAYKAIQNFKTAIDTPTPPPTA